jgi:hypothetical protein
MNTTTKSTTPPDENAMDISTAIYLIGSEIEGLNEEIFRFKASLDDTRSTMRKMVKDVLMAYAMHTNEKEVMKLAREAVKDTHPF